MKRKILGLICIISLLLITGCQLSKKALSNEEFSNIAQKKGLTPVDVKDQFSNYDTIQSATIAVSQDGWQIEYYVLSTKEKAKKMYNKNVNGLEKEYNPSVIISKIEVGNYNKYNFETKEVYVYLTRVDNTFLYAKVPKENKEAAKEFIKELKY